MTKLASAIRKDGRLWRLIAAAVVMLVLILFLGGCADTIRVGNITVQRDALSLNLQGANIQDIDPLLSMETLQRLDIRDNEIKVADYEALAAALPACDIRWSVPIAGQYMDSHSEDLILPGFAAADVAMLAYFPHLKSVDASGSTAYMALREGSSQYPNCDFRWTVTLGDRHISCETESLDLSGQTLDAAMLTEALDGLPKLKEIDLRGTGLDGTTVFPLFATHPNIQVYADVTLFGLVCDTQATQIDLSGTGASEASLLLNTLGYFSNLESVNLSGCPMESADKLALMEAFPDINFFWEVELLPGLKVKSDQTEIVVKGYDAPDVDALIESLQYLPMLEKLDLTACYKPSDETNQAMEKLMAAYPDVKFVWLVRVANWELRTDAIHFSMGNQKTFDGGRFLGGEIYPSVTNASIQALQYCTDLIALDMGHAKRLTDISCIAGLTKIRYLILGMTSITSLDTLSGMTELEFLECYQCYITDLSPLLNCKKLKYLNCSTTFIETIDDVIQMTQLKRLWIMRAQVWSKDDIAAIKAALPNTIIRSVMEPSGHSTTGGWRTKNPAYLHMQRDLFQLVLQDQNVTKVGDQEYWGWDLEAFEAE